MKRRAFIAVIATALLGTAVFSGGAFAQRGGGPPHAPGEEEEGGANNLSVPAIFVPGTAGSPFTGTCDDEEDDSFDPIGDTGVLVGEEIEHPGYYVQGVATWQADCATAGTVTVAAEWGDNLTNAPLKAGTPIRTEIGFLAKGVASMTGYEVVKLDPTLLDRESHYGTLGISDLFSEVRVWSSDVTLDIRSKDGTVVVQNNQPYSAEVNSTGRIVYGFNWQNPVAGEYTITVTAPNIVIDTVDAGTLVDDHTVTLDVTVGNKGGGGGGGGGRPGDRPRGGGGGRGNPNR